VEPIPTFWTERTGTAEVSLRIFTFGRASNNQHDTDQPCPAHPALEVGNGHTYQQGHDASAVVFIEYPMVLDADRPGAIGSIDATSEEWRSHPLWPASCALCGLEFGADYGQRQVNQEPYYAAADGRKWLQRDLPPGAQYAADWLPDSWKRDGFGLAVIVPGGPDGTGHQWLPERRPERPRLDPDRRPETRPSRRQPVDPRPRRTGLARLPPARLPHRGVIAP
jgi:hypothetical protein